MKLQKQHSLLLRIKVKTIAKRHIEQIPIEHYWAGEFDFTGKTILGRLTDCGCLLDQYDTLFID